MFWFGLATGIAASLVFVFLILAFVRTTKDQAWMDEERKFRNSLLNQWERANADNETRNCELRAIRERMK